MPSESNHTHREERNQFCTPVFVFLVAETHLSRREKRRSLLAARALFKRVLSLIKLTPRRCAAAVCVCERVLAAWHRRYFLFDRTRLVGKETPSTESILIRFYRLFLRAQMFSNALRLEKVLLPV